jgi:hypothetical protein
MLSGRGDRCLVELEAFQLDATMAHVGMAAFAGRSFRVTIEEIEDLTKLDNETSKGAERKITRVGRRRA